MTSSFGGALESVTEFSVVAHVMDASRKKDRDAVVTMLWLRSSLADFSGATRGLGSPRGALSVAA